MITTKLISERKQLGTIYHFTKITSIKSILGENAFKGSEIGTWNYERDFQFFKKDEKFFKEKGITHLYFFSTTRNKLLYRRPSYGIGGMSARIVLDGDKLSSKYRFVPFRYYDDEPKHEGSDESEERIILGLKKEIPNAKSYIKEIHIILDVIEDNEAFLQEAEKLQDYDPSLIKFYYKEKETTLEDYKTNILPTIEPYREEEIDESDSFEYRGGPILHESFTPQKAPLMGRFVNYACDRLNIDKPQIKLINSPEYTQEHHSFGGYFPQEQKIHVVVHNRNMADILRTLAHELVHHMQNLNGMELNGEDGSNTENEANAMAGVIMREFGRENPEIFESKLDEGIIITCKNCGWHWPLADGGNDPYVCHKCGHNNMKN